MDEDTEMQDEQDDGQPYQPQINAVAVKAGIAVVVIFALVLLSAIL